jgi:hypothetical protein
MKKLIYFALLMALVFAANSAVAAEFFAPNRSDNGNITLPSAEAHKNLYIAGANVTVNSNTIGDLFAAGANVNIFGTVEKDLNAAGSVLNINNTVGGNARLAGGNVNVNFPVGGDLLVGGGFVAISEKSHVGGDLVLAGGNVTIDAPINGYARIYGGNILINSKIDGNVFVETKDKNGKLTFGPNARVSGEITYKGVQQAEVRDGAKISEIKFTKLETPNVGAQFRSLLTLVALVKLFALFLAVLLLSIFFKKPALSVIVRGNEKPWQYLGIGLIALIFVPIVTLFLFITVIGSYLALLLLAVFALLALLATMMAPILVGSWMYKTLNKKPEFAVDWRAAILGVVALLILSWIPIVGCLLNFLIFLLAFGVVVKLAWERIQKSQAPEPPAPTLPM